MADPRAEKPKTTGDERRMGCEDWELWLLAAKGDRASWTVVVDAGNAAKVSDVEAVADLSDQLRRYRYAGLVNARRRRKR